MIDAVVRQMGLVANAREPQVSFSRFVAKGTSGLREWLGEGGVVAELTVPMRRQ
jgi:hypothetical protein